MRRIKWCLLVLITIGSLVALTYFFFWPSSTIEIIRLDALGTKIMSNKVVNGKLGFPVKKQSLKLKGYQLVHGEKLRFRHDKYRVKIAYKPIKSTSQVKSSVSQARYVGVTFQVLNNGLNKRRQNYQNLKSEEDRLRIILSDDGIHWKRLATNYPNVAVRDPSIIKIGSKWWIVYTNGAMWTENFRTWHHVYLNYNPNNHFQKVWAPEFYRLKNGQLYVVAACSTDGVHFNLYRFRFDSKHGSVSMPEALNIGNTAHNNLIDPHITTSRDGYVLWAKDETRHYLVRATSKNGVKFTQFKHIGIKMSSNLIPEGPTTIDENGHTGLLFFDLYNASETFSGVHVVKFRNDELTTSPIRIKSSFLVRHFGVYRNK